MAKPKRVTMLDVARAADVSYQTVSRVINNHPSVAASTRARVLEIIEQLNYRPSKVARSLATSQSRTIAVIASELQNYGPAQMVLHIEQAAKAAGYDLVFTHIDPNRSSDMMATVDNMIRRAIDGVVLIAPVQSSQYEQIVQQFQHTPLVQIDIAPGTETPSVIIDQFQGGYDVTTHLLDLGHQAFCTITGPMHSYGARARHKGCLSALKQAGIAPLAITHGDWTPMKGYHLAMQLLAERRFTALVVGNDQMAIGAMSAIYKRHLRIPQDVSVVGFDDIPEAAYLHPALTTIRQDFSELGRQVVAQLLRLIATPDEDVSQVVIPASLIIRESTMPPQ